MAKRRKKTTKQRYTNAITKIPNLLFDKKQKYKRSTYENTNQIDDGRRFRPTTYRASHLFDGNRTKVEIYTNSNIGRNKRIPTRIAYGDTRKTIVCRKRRNRRQSLFQQGKIGKGVRVSSIRKTTPNSSIICKRRK